MRLNHDTKCKLSQPSVLKFFWGLNNVGFRLFVIKSKDTHRQDARSCRLDNTRTLEREMSIAA